MRKSTRSSIILNSFEELRGFLHEKVFPPSRPAEQKSPPRKKEPELSHADEGELFQQAVADVTPLSPNGRRETPPPSSPPVPVRDEEEEIVKQLTNLVTTGDGFILSQTPEYIEGTGYNVNPRTAERLHRGEFAMEAHIDLHGLSVAAARETFDLFLQETLRKGKKAVLIIHGRGLSSPERPVLKTKVIEWLTRGPWRKWVVAFASARACDGGTGATYVLLRRRPYSKEGMRVPTRPHQERRK
ncbi:MAG: Smr/MutS family protein [Deltaproteobacteria bacterium]|nr:Smr/MutS family protein [Deltaproteobacteria bacterium]